MKRQRISGVDPDTGEQSRGPVDAFPIPAQAAEAKPEAEQPKPEPVKRKRTRKA